MASIREATEIIAEATGADTGTVRQLARCLGEGGMLGPRLPGRKAFQLEPIHIARMIIGLLAMGHLGVRRNQRVITSMPISAELVPMIEALETGGDPGIEYWENTKTGELSEEYVGSFVGWIASMIELPKFAELRCDCIGLTFAGDGQFYAVMQTAPGERIIFGDMDAVEAHGLTRTVTITSSAIAKVAAAIAPDEAQTESGPQAEANEPLRSAPPSGDGSGQRHRTDTHACVQDGGADLFDGPQHQEDRLNVRNKSAQRAAA